LRDFLEERFPRLIGLWNWPSYRLFGRCFACGRLVILHSPWALYICERTPLPIKITERGMARLVVEEAGRLTGDAA
jgi:hypothetical protein